jgi:hypothetical protein
MKTQIITLESHDDLISVRDRMSWAKSPRILLVWPKFEKVTLRPVDLRVLQHHAKYLGAELGLVTRRSDIKRDAQGFGIPVFKSTASAQRDPWPERRSNKRHRPRTSHPNLRAMRAEAQVKEAGWRSNLFVRTGFFALGVLAVLAVAALFVPRAAIKLTPVTQQQSVTIPVTASESISSVFLTGSIPAHPFSVTVNAAKSVNIISESQVGQFKAKGIAHFKNLTQSEILIPAGTVVYGGGQPPIRFVTMNNTRLVGNANAFVEVPITAVAAGEAGNLPANSIQGIEGSLSLSASVTNLQPTSGGVDLTTVAATDDDRKKLRSDVLDLLNAEAHKKIKSSIGAQDILLVNTLKMGQVLDETYDPPAGQAGSLLSLKMSAEFTAQYVSADDLTRLAKSSLDASVPNGFVASPSTLMFKPLADPVFDQAGASHFDLQAEQTVTQRIEPLQVVLLARGLSPASAAKTLFDNLSLSAAPQIDLSPSWWPWLPLIPFRIEVK